MKTNKNGHTAQLTPSASTTKNVGQSGTKQSYRYPGAQPFSTSQSNIFFGREQDALDLFHLIKLEPLVVVHARSGLGKSSLLNAGIIPHIMEEGEYTPITIRFGAYRQENGQNLPLNITRSRVEEHLHSAEASFLDELLENNGSLWYMFAREHTFDLGRRKFLLIFDQFEELTTYPETAVHSFKTQLAELFYSQIPERFRQPVEMEVASPKILTRSQLSLLHEPLQLKIVLAIRSDRISLLDQLSTHLPLVKRSWFELGSLTEQQAEEAILSPAYKAGSFLSPIFDFEDEAIEAMLSFLTKGHSENIESFQLQILCQSIEQKVIQQGLKMVTLADLGNIQEVYENYYEDRIRSLGSMEDQNAARQFIEDGLIFEEEERRLSLYEGQIHSTFGISDELLRRLVDTHLIRREPSAKGGYLYELSHDTLVAPVLKAKAVRVAEEEKRKGEAEVEKKRLEYENKINEQRRRNRYLILFSSLLLVVTSLAIWKWIQAENYRSIINGELNEAREKLESLEINIDSTQQQLEYDKNIIDSLLSIAKTKADKFRKSPVGTLAGLVIDRTGGSVIDGEGFVTYRSENPPSNVDSFSFDMLTKEEGLIVNPDYPPLFADKSLKSWRIIGGSEAGLQFTQMNFTGKYDVNGVKTISQSSTSIGQPYWSLWAGVDFFKSDDFEVIAEFKHAPTKSNYSSVLEVQFPNNLTERAHLSFVERTTWSELNLLVNYHFPIKKLSFGDRVNYYAQFGGGYTWMRESRFENIVLDPSWQDEKTMLDALIITREGESLRRMDNYTLHAGLGFTYRISHYLSIYGQGRYNLRLQNIVDEQNRSTNPTLTDDFYYLDDDMLLHGISFSAGVRLTHCFNWKHK
jgi:hypothetical protein